MNKNSLILHFSVLLLSFPALFARGLDLVALVIIWWRCFFAFIFLQIFFLIKPKKKIPTDSYKWLIFSGLLLGLHWWMFFSSIQLSNVSLGLITFFTFPIFGIFIEAAVFRTKINLYQIIRALGVIMGVYILVPAFTLENNITKGILLGLLAALFYVIRMIVIKKCLVKISTINILYYQLIVACLVISLPFLSNTHQFIFPSGTELILLMLLASIFTLGSHGLMVYTLKCFSVTTVGIVGALEVIYASILAAFIFKEIPDLSFYVGASIILSSALYELYKNNHN